MPAGAPTTDPRAAAMAGARRRPAIALVLAGLLLLGLGAGCGSASDGDGETTPTPETGAVTTSASTTTTPSTALPAAPEGERFALAADVQLSSVGEGSRRAYVAQVGERKPGAPVVIFWHGFGSATIDGYEPWIAHIAHNGATVIFPSWQTPGKQDTGELKLAFDASTAAIAQVLDALPDHGPIVAAGVSAGGELAVDYTVAAPREKQLPAPVALYAVYPGRALPGGPVLLPPQKGSVPKDTHLVAVASIYDKSAGTRWARAIVEAATALPAARKRLIIVKDRAVGDHLAPALSTPLAQKTFWAPLDRLIAQAKA